MTARRRFFSRDFKTKMIRDYETGKFTINELCSKHKVSPTQFYKWKNETTPQTESTNTTDLQKENAELKSVISLIRMITRD